MPLCVAVFALCGLLLPLFFPLSLIPFFVCRAFAVRHGHPSPVIFLFFYFIF
jgi:hypothetical protein